MAIAKVKSSKVEYSAQAIIQMAVAAGLVLISLIMGYFAVARFMLKRNMYAGVQAMDRNRQGDVEPALRSAISWKPSFHPARMLLAKRLVDAGSLEEAEQNYQQLIAEGYENASICNVGLGVIELRRADKSKDAKEFAKHIGAAQGYYKLAGGVPEGAIGLKHAELIQALRAGDAAKLVALRADFKKLLDQCRTGGAGAQVTKEGFIDLYSGLGISYAYGGRYSSDAATYFEGCFQYAPKWPLPLLNSVYIKAEKYAQTPMEVASLTQERTRIEQLRNDWRNLWATGNPEYKDLKEPWYQYYIATTYRFGEAGDLPTYRSWVYQLTTTDEWKTRPETWRLECGVNLRLGMAETKDLEVRNNYFGLVGQSINQFEAVDNAQRDDPAINELRAILRVTKGLCFEQQGARQLDNSMYDRAIKEWQDALKIEKDKLKMPDGSYEANRNIAVVLKRMNKPEAEPYYQAAVKVGEASGSAKVRRDLDGLKRFWSTGKAPD